VPKFNCRHTIPANQRPRRQKSPANTILGQIGGIVVRLQVQVTSATMPDAVEPKAKVERSAVPNRVFLVVVRGSSPLASSSCVNIIPPSSSTHRQGRENPLSTFSQAKGGGEIQASQHARLFSPKNALLRLIPLFAAQWVGADNVQSSLLSRAEGGPVSPSPNNGPLCPPS